MHQKNSTSGNDDLDLGNFARRLLVRKGVEGWFSPGERAYYEALAKHGGLTVGNVNGVQNKTGAKLVTLLGKTDSDLIPALYAVEGIEENPLEEFLGKLSAFFEKKGAHSVYEYIQVIRPWGNPNVYPMSLQKPLLHFLCMQYGTEYARNRYTLLELIEDFLSLDGVDVNILDNDGRHIFDMFETYDLLQSDKNQSLLQLLADAGASWEDSTLWMISNTGYIVPRQSGNMNLPQKNPNTKTNEDLGVGKADPYYQEYLGYPTNLGNMIDATH